MIYAYNSLSSTVIFSSYYHLSPFTNVEFPLLCLYAGAEPSYGGQNNISSVLKVEMITTYLWLGLLLRFFDTIAQQALSFSMCFATRYPLEWEKDK